MATRKDKKAGLDGFAQLEQLPREELQAWVHDRLHGRDLLLSGFGGRDGMPHYAVVQFYRRADRHTRQDIEDIIKNAVRDLATTASPNWNGEAGTELLLLAQQLCDRSIAPYFVQMVRSGGIYDANTAGGSSDLHQRALQCLVALNWNEEPADFWREQAALNPAIYTGLAFDGLALLDPAEALNFLGAPDTPWNDELEVQILASVAELLANLGHAVVTTLFKQYRSRMPQNARIAIGDFLVTEGIVIDPAEPWAEASKWSDHEKFVGPREVAHLWGKPEEPRRSKELVASANGTC